MSFKNFRNQQHIESETTEDQKTVQKKIIETCFSEEELQNSLSDEGQTIIHCYYVSPKRYMNGGWINIWPTTYLCNHAEPDELGLLHALEVPLHPNKHYFQRSGEAFTFTLIFPIVPKSWVSFTLKERTGNRDGFVVKEIRRNDTGIYHVRIT